MQRHEEFGVLGEEIEEARQRLRDVERRRQEAIAAALLGGGLLRAFTWFPRIGPPSNSLETAQEADFWSNRDRVLDVVGRERGESNSGFRLSSNPTVSFYVAPGNEYFKLTFLANVSEVGEFVRVHGLRLTVGHVESEIRKLEVQVRGLRALLALADPPSEPG